MRWVYKSNHPTDRSMTESTLIELIGLYLTCSPNVTFWIKLDAVLAAHVERITIILKRSV